MKMIFCSSIYNMREYEILQKKSKDSLSLADHTLNYNIIKGLDCLSEQETILVNSIPIPSFPNFSQLFIRKELWEHNKPKLEKDVNIGYINFPIFKQISKYFFCYFHLKKILQSNVNEDLVLLVYDMHIPLVKAMIRIRNNFSKVSICAVLPDIPETMINVVFGEKPSMMARYYVKQKMKYINCFDGYVFLTEHMKEKVNVTSKPYVVVEGIYDNSNLTSPIATTKEDRKIIMYSGALRTVYGVKRIVHIVADMQDDGYELWICGHGELTDYIKDQSKTFNNIKYFGYLNSHEICTLQGKATTLINPRRNDAEYTRYSFPSKTMEYLASGKPVIGYILDGFPREYKMYMQVPEDESDEALKRKIIEICSLPKQTRDEMGQKSREFILEQKNPKAQCEKIMTMLEGIVGGTP